MKPASAHDKLSLISRAKAGEKVAKLCREAKISRKTFYQWLKKYNSTKPNLAIYKLADHRFKKNFSLKSVHWKDKLLLINKYLAKEDTAVEICRKFNISRKSLYAWLKNYQKNGESGLYEMRSRGENHYKYLAKDAQELILYAVAQHPEFSVHTLSKTLSVGHHGIQNLLERKGLSTHQSRKIFAEGYITTPKTKVSPLYEPQIPVYRLRQIIAPFTTIPKIIKQDPKKGFLALLASSVPLLIFYFWIKLLIFAPAGQSKVGIFFATISLSFGVVFFLYSLKYYLSIIMVLKLANSGLSGTGQQQVTRKAGGILAKILNLPFKYFNKHSAKSINPLFINFDKINLSEKPFVSIHVAVYNEKNVIERLIGACTSQDWFVSANSSTPGESKPTPGVSLGGNPERSRRANYEVVLVDDSTDETTEMAKQTLIDHGWLLSTSSHPGVATTVLEGTDRIGSQTSVQERDSIAEFTLERSEGLQNDRGIDQNDRGIDTSVFTKSGGPTVKLIHRSSRSGFKGGALQRALEETDPKANYIVVFDADFVPYPDTIEQFMKAFQVLGTGTSGQGLGVSDKGLDPKPYTLMPNPSPIAAVQGYQWHVLNKSQTWVTRGVRTEYAGSYVIERSGEEIYGGLKQIAGSVYAIRADILRQFGWGTSITEDFELTLRLYEAGYKIAFTPYIQAPAEAVSTIKRLIRQRMRWAEGASFNIKVMLARMLFGRWVEASQISNYSNYSNYSNQTPNPKSQLGQLEIRSIRNSKEEPQNQQKVWIPSKLTLSEKLEFIYLAPYYLQAAFFVVGTLSWFLSEAVLKSPLPFWTSAFGWSLVFTNLISLPLMNVVGLFLEESDERDYFGVLSFIALSYIVVPFQAYAAVKGFLEREEGPWFRTPKTGLITDVLERSSFGKFFGNIFGKPAAAVADQTSNVILANEVRPESGSWSSQDDKRVPNFAFAGALRLSSVPSAFRPLQGNMQIKPRHIRWVGNFALALVLMITISMSIVAPFIPQATSYASEPVLRTVANLEETNGPKEPEEPKGKKNPKNKDEILRNATAREITTPRLISKTTKEGKTVEFIFHQEPRVRIKLGKPASAEGFGEVNEVEFETKSVFGQRANPVKATIYQDKEVVYREIIKDVDLKYTVVKNQLVEEFIIKTPEAAVHLRGENSSHLGSEIEQTVKTVDVKVVSPSPGLFGFYSNDGEEIFQFSQPFIKDAKGKTTDNLQLTIDKPFDFAQGYRLTKTLGEQAKQWLADPARVFPVSIDPSVVVSGTIDETEVQFGGLQRKLVYASSNWYAFYDESDVFYKKSSDGSTWGTAVDVDTTDADNKNPSVWLEGTTIYASWVDTGDTLTTEFLEVNTINTASADALGTKCTSADLGGSAGDPSTITVSIAVADNGTVYLAETETGSGALATVFSLAFSGCTFTNITTGSGLTALDRPVVVTMGNNLQMIFQDAGDLSQSMYNGTSWTVANTTIAAVTDNIYSVTTDETTLWVLSVSGTTATNFYSCPASCDGDTWVDEADPWTGQTNVTSVSLTYDSTNSDLYAHIIKDTDEKAYWKSTDATDILWGSENDYGWSGTGDYLGHISAPLSGAGTSQIGAVLRQSTNFEFAQVPERLFYLLVGVPFMPKLFGKLKRKGKSF